MITFDTETCGLHGPITLIQYARDDGEIFLHSVWNEPIKDTIDLIHDFCDDADGVVGFNLAFDWFHICQLYTTLQLLPKRTATPSEFIKEYALAEPQARFGLCVKPKSAMDVMLHARKGPYQSTMDRNDIKIKRVPTVLAWQIAAELDARIPLKDVYFARRKDSSVRWQVQDVFDDFGDVIPEFKDIVLKFMPSSALKALAADALGIDTEKIKLFADVEPNWKPTELGYAPFAMAVAMYHNGVHKKEFDGRWENSWPVGITGHISHWSYNTLARKYASDDVDYTRRLYEYFEKPSMGDTDSILACMVGANRWRGYAIDIPKLTALKKKAQKAIQDSKINFQSVDVCRKYLYQVMSETEKLVMRVNDKITTKAIVLEEVSKWVDSEVHKECNGFGCDGCKGGLIDTDKPHPAAIRAREILDARHAKKEIENYDKLIVAGRFHASFTIIGALSNRMSGGGGGLNAQGIKRANYVRQCFPLADEGLVLCGGDFDGFEVCIMDAAYGDPVLHAELTSGKKIHGLFGIELFPHMTYDEILATKGLADEHDIYTRSKNGVFAICYGGEAFTLTHRVGVPIEVAEVAYASWCKKHQVWGQKRLQYANMFCSMRQPGGIGTNVEWHEPAPYIESMFGFRRYYTLENQIVKALYELATHPPEDWVKRYRIKVMRRDREQTASGACRSALYAAAFAVQSSNMRSAGNHVIQSTGATVTKELQAKIWEIQPTGIHRWRVQPMNVHDEINTPTHPDYVKSVTKIVKSFIEGMKSKIPLISMTWKTKLKTWADK